MSDVSEQLKQQRQAANIKMDKYRTIDLQIDTLAYKGSTLGYFSPDKNSVTINYRPDNDYLNNMAEGTTVSHEQKHRDNYLKGIKNYVTSIEQSYKLDMHDEISANMVQLITLRDEYITTGDIHVFDKNMDKFDFYVDAIKDGRVDPLSQKQADFDNDMSLIANGTQKMWMDKYSTVYVNQNKNNALYSFIQAKERAKPNEKNYQRGLEIAYNIGGVDFNKYIKKDVICPNPMMKELDKSLADGKSYQEVYLQAQNMPKYEENMSLEQYHKLTQHKLLAESLRHEIILGKKEIDAFSAEDKETYRKMLNNKLKSGEKELDSEKNNINYCMTLVLGDNGERVIIPSKNDDSYEKELDRLYTSNGVNSRSFLDIKDEKVLPHELPEQVKEFTEKNIVVRSLAKLGRLEIDAFNKVKSWFSSDNKPLAKINNDAPEYRKWSKESRVSEVQNRKILDFTKDVIRKPQPEKPLASRPTPKTSPAPVKRPPMPTTTRPLPRPVPVTTSKASIKFSEITASYSSQELANLCQNPQRWNQGKSCDSTQYKHAAEVTGLPAEFIAYAYEVNRKNFPKESALGDKVKDGSSLSSQEIASEIASVVGKYDIEKGAFFSLRSSPRKISCYAGAVVQSPSEASRISSTSNRFKELRGVGGGTESLIQRRSSIPNTLSNADIAMRYKMTQIVRANN